MKSKIFSFVALAAFAAGTVSCSDDTWNNNPDQTGETGTLNTASITATVVNAESVLTDSKANTHSSRAVTDLSNYLITIVNANGDVVENWTYSTMPVPAILPVGTYKVQVRSHEVKGAAWNEPYFCGEQQFSIAKDAFTDVEPVVCKLANIRVSIIFDAKLLAASGSDLKVTVKSTEGNELEFTPSESRSGFFAAEEGLETLALTFSGTVNGYAENYQTVLTNVAAGQHRMVTYKLRQNTGSAPDETGSIGGEGGINVDLDIIGQDLTSDNPFEETLLDPSGRPIEGKPDGPDVPNPPVSEDVATFTSETLDLAGVNAVSDFAREGESGPEPIQDAVINISVPNGVANLLVTIKNTNLESLLPGVGLAPQFDLAYPGSLSDTLSGSFGFPVGDEVIGKTEVTFNITQFVPLLSLYPNEDYEFQIDVTNQKGNTTPNGTLHLKFKS